jgi:hypothetical protein
MRSVLGDATGDIRLGIGGEKCSSRSFAHKIVLLRRDTPIAHAKLHDYEEDYDEQSHEF